MPGAGVKPPAPPVEAATGLPPRRLTPSRVSAKRSWPPGCGRFPAPLPAPASPAAAGPEVNGVDGAFTIVGGRADDEAAPAVISPSAQNGCPDKVEEAVAAATVSPLPENGAPPRPQGSDKVEEAAATVSPLPENGAPPRQQGSDKVEEAVAAATVSPLPQNGAPPRQQGSDKVEEVADPAAVSPVAQSCGLPHQEDDKVDDLSAVLPAARSSALPHALPQSGPERARQDGDGGENGEVQLVGGAVKLSSDGQQGDRVVQVAGPTLEVLGSCTTVGASSMQNGGEGDGLLVAAEKGCGGSSDMGQEVAANDFTEIENKTGTGELQGKENGIAGSRTKRWSSESSLNPLPKRRAVSAVRKFPPGCGRTIVTTADSGVLEVSPIRSFAPSFGMSAVNTTGSGDREWLPSEATPVNNGDALVAIPVLVLGESAFPTSAIEASNKKVESKKIVDEGHSKAHNRVQVRDDFAGTKQDGDQRNVVSKATQRNVSDEKMNGKFSAHKGEQVAQEMVDHKMKNELESSLQRSNLRTPLSNPIDVKVKRLDSGKMNAGLLGNARSSAGGKMQSKTLSAKKEVSSNMNTKQNKFAHKLKSDDTSKGNLHLSARESKLGTHVAINQIEEPNQIIVQALMAPDNCPWTRGRKSFASASKSLVPRNKLKGKDGSASKSLVRMNKIKEKDTTRKDILARKVTSNESINDETMDDNETRGREPIDSTSKWLVPVNKLDATPNDIPVGKVVSCDSSNDEAMDDNDGIILEDDDNSRALVVYGQKQEMCLTVLPVVPSGSHHKQSRDHDIDARSKVRKLLQLFQATYRKLTQVEEQGKRKVGRIDIEAAKALKNDPIYKKLGAVVGNFPGVEVGDEFHFRVELSIIGLHGPLQAGIATSKVNGINVAISIVASGGYPDELSSSDELIYTGSGGKAGGNKEGDDQKLERGNLALKNCIETKTPVRVIHGFKGQNRSEIGHSKGKQTSIFIYDGLYEVLECWQEGPKGERVFKYKLQRIAGQPELALHAVKATRKSKVREGLCLPDISQGRERIPICVINTIDDMKPAPFKYITEVIYPDWYEKEPPKGCNCTNGCSDSITCACAVKNGGEIMFNFNGAIVEARPLIYECGPSCRCPPTCHNRVSQHGVKIPLEIFKTGKTGWGVRSLSSISSGSFICEYTGELLEDEEAEKRENDEYLFDIGHNYHDKELWEGLKSVVGLGSATSSSETMEGFTIDASECGNVGRFINHSCSPNLYAQNVLWDHDDMRMPHVMFFAVENIPPLQELTYHYNYKIGEVYINGEEKVKHCYCGASDCCGRLY
ncbi:uncharacterized protein [Zea mays]|uniref:Histone-lysine N-methyltransferase H3 lysine-9 specific SUVH5 n=1 Tax=Zea mays TaxID=4577 RepID=A0A1D6EPB3_MAIZE|nr:uncharacterized protein LOC103647380 [Zea mays]ONM21611.1 Histone-lysine N-methyltransferase H3 lysine-9 specific SUVH5 [Zea mays]ONM21614.1 Histone-lysine N-methyltransferase H3 lysine-9 specific SUVH5 [Zea mays]|eukprot:XP_008670145.1 uncharacterized protein LOC103647380 [Zea mays]